MKRAANVEPMPHYVRTWLDTVFNPDPGAKAAPPQPLGWLVKTIDDPDWIY